LKLSVIPPVRVALSVLSLTLFTSNAFCAPTKPGKPAQKSQINWEEFKKTANRGSIGTLAAVKALSYRGTPYVMGGHSKSGIDCSGLTQSVYKQWGLLLPRTSTEQFSKGISVPKDQLRAGDLVFFKNTYKSGVSHVGIFIGANHFVHAAGRGKGVVISSLSDAYNLNHWAGARRIALDKEPVSKTVMLEEPAAEKAQ
jgi:cell wall-associated NlpC family hydrolase